MRDQERRVVINDIPGMIDREVIIANILPSGTEIKKHDGSLLHVPYNGAYNNDAYTFRASDPELRELFYVLKEHLRIGENRPYETGKLEATEKHLEDMRTLVFKTEITHKLQD